MDDFSQLPTFEDIKDLPPQARVRFALESTMLLQRHLATTQSEHAGEHTAAIVDAIEFAEIYA